MADDTCPSCGVAYTDHLGLIGTCAQLQEARAALNAVFEASPVEHGIAFTGNIAQYVQANFEALRSQRDEARADAAKFRADRDHMHQGLRELRGIAKERTALQREVERLRDDVSELRATRRALAEHAYAVSLDAAAVALDTSYQRDVRRAVRSRVEALQQQCKALGVQARGMEVDHG